MPWPVLSFLMPPTDVPWLLPTLLSERAVEDLRHRQGISYSLDGDHTLVNGQLLVALMPDGRPDHETPVTEALWRALTTLAESGPTPAELANAVDGTREEMLDPRSTFDHVLEAAARQLCGDPPLSVTEQLELAAAVTPAQVQDLARVVLDSALLGIPAVSKPDLGELPDLTEHSPPSGTPATGKTFRRKRWCLAPRDLRAVVGEDALSLTAASHTLVAKWDDVVGVAATAGDRVIVRRDGMDFQLCDKHLRDADRLFALIDQRAGDNVFALADDALH